jgi:alpha/beta superfamily hydrolase
MHTKAVYRTAQALNDAGLVALRFNFRGVGSSTGSYDEGVGEQDDVRAALDWLEERYQGLPLVAGGFSFGSKVGLSVGAEDPRVAGLVGLGLPIERDVRYDYGFLATSVKPVLLVQGEIDEFGSGERVAGVVAALGSHVTLIRVAGADHYFTDRLEELGAAVRGYFESGPGKRLLVP